MIPIRFADQAWRDEAACRGADSAIFFPDARYGFAEHPTIAPAEAAVDALIARPDLLHALLDLSEPIRA